MAKPAAVAYFRTSSAANVGADKDSERRQREAVAAYVKAAKLEVASEFYDAAVSGADPVDSRTGFVALLAYCTEHGVTTVLVENASRFARDLVVQLSQSIPAPAISPLRQRLIDDMNMRQFSRETQRNYIRDVGRFATVLGRSPDTATTDDVRRFQIEQHMPACRRQP